MTEQLNAAKRRNYKKSKSFSFSVKLLLTVFFAVTVLLPIISIARKINMNAVRNVIDTNDLGMTALNSLLVSVSAMVISVLIAYMLALAINRSRIPFKGALNLLITLPMLIPSVSHGIGLINLFGANGLFTNMFGIDISLLGFKGILLGSMLYSFPVAYLMLSDAMKYSDATVYEAADVLGVPRVSRFFNITLHFMKRPIISASFAVFTMVFTDYGVPLAVGGRFKTLPIYLYEEVIGRQNFSNGALIGMLLLIPAVLTFLLDLFKKDSENLSFSAKKMHIKRNRPRDITLGVLSVSVVLSVLTVIGSFIIMTFVTKYPYNQEFTMEHIQRVLDKGIVKFFANSIVISLLVSLLGTAVAYITAYCTARTSNSLITRLLHLTAIAPIAIPGMVLGLGYIITFKGTPIYGTIMIIIVVNIIHFFSSPYMMAQNAMNKMNKNYEDVGKTLSVGRLRLLRDVLIPNSIDTIAEMTGYFFVNSMITISAVTFLYNTRTMPLSIMITELKDNLLLESAAFVSIVILLSNIAVKIIITLVKRLVKRRSGHI